MSFELAGSTEQRLVGKVPSDLKFLTRNYVVQTISGNKPKTKMAFARDVSDTLYKEKVRCEYPENNDFQVYNNYILVSTRLLPVKFPENE